MFRPPPSQPLAPAPHMVTPGNGAGGDGSTPFWRPPTHPGGPPGAPRAIPAPGSPHDSHVHHRPTLSLLPPGGASHVKSDDATPPSHGAHALPGAYHGQAAKAPYGTYPAADLPSVPPPLHMAPAPYPPTPSQRSEGLSGQGERARAHGSSVSLVPAAQNLHSQGQVPLQPYTAQPGDYRAQDTPEETLPTYHGQGPSPHLGAHSPSAGAGHQQHYPSGAPVGYGGRDTPSHAREVGSPGAPQWKPYQAFPPPAGAPGQVAGPSPGFPPHNEYAPTGPPQVHPPAGYPLLPSPQGQQGAGGHLAVPPSTPIGHTPPAPLHSGSPSIHTPSSLPPPMPAPFYSPRLEATPGAPSAQSQAPPPAAGAPAPSEEQKGTPVLLPLTQALSSAPLALAKLEEALAAPATTPHGTFGVHRRKQGLDRRDLPEDGYSWHKYGHKTLMGLFSRAYYRCTQRGSGCRAKKTVDTALKGANEVRITYDGGHNHDPEREVLEGVMVVSITDSKGRGQGESAQAAPASPAQHIQRPAAGVPALHAPGPGDGSGKHSAPPLRTTVEIRQRKPRKVVLVNEGSEARPVAPEAYRKLKVVEEGEASSGDEGVWRGTNKREHGAFDALPLKRCAFDRPAVSLAGPLGVQSSPLGKPQVHRSMALAQPQGAQRPSRDPFEEHQERFLEQLASRQRWAGEDTGHASGNARGHASGSPRSEDSAVLEQLSPGHGQGPNDGGPGVAALDSDKKLGRLSDFSLCGPAAAVQPTSRRESGGLDLDLKL